MINLYLDNKLVFFDGNKEIKLIKNNPYLTESGTYSLEVDIPLDIPENLAVFGPIQRKEISKESKKFGARMIARSKEIFNGSAKITSITETSAKIQLKGGNSDLNLIIGSEDIYIDELPYENIDMGELLQENGAEPEQTVPETHTYTSPLRAYAPHNWAKVRTYDTDNEAVMNGDGEEVAISPNLLLVVRAVVAALGFKVTDCCFDNTPIGDLFMVSGYRCGSNWTMADVLKGYLPHWTVQEFFTEIQNLLNCTIAFKETGKSVSIIHNTPNGMTELKVTDEYTVEIDEEKRLKTPSTSNLCYKCAGEDNTGYYIDPTIHEKFEHKIFNSNAELIQYVNANKSIAKFYLLHCPEATAIYVENDNEIYYTDLYGMRYVGSTEEKELKICPVVYGTFDNPVTGDPDAAYEVKGPNPLVAGITVTPANIILAYEEDYSNYASKGEAKPDEIRILSCTGWNSALDNNYIMSLHVSSEIYTKGVIAAPTLTIGDLFVDSLEIKDTVMHRFNFVSVDVPDVNNVFLIHNKKYICKKIEYTMKDDGIKPMMTGEFYELKL